MSERRDSLSSNGSIVFSPGVHPDLDALSDLEDFELVSEDDTDDARSSVSQGEDLALTLPLTPNIADESEPELSEGEDEGLSGSLSGSSIFRSTARLSASEEETATPLARSTVPAFEPVVEPSAPVEAPTHAMDVDPVFTGAYAEPAAKLPAQKPTKSIAQTLDVLTAKSPSFWLRFLQAYKPSSALFYCAAVLAVVGSGMRFYGQPPAAPALAAPTAVTSLSLFGTPLQALAVTGPSCGRQRTCEVAVVQTAAERTVFTSRPPVVSVKNSPANVSTWKAAMDALDLAAEAWSTAHLRILEAIEQAELGENARKVIKRSQHFVSLAHDDSKRILRHSHRVWSQVSEDWESRRADLLGADGKRVLNRARRSARKLVHGRHATKALTAPEMDRARRRAWAKHHRKHSHRF